MNPGRTFKNHLVEDKVRLADFVESSLKIKSQGDEITGPPIHVGRVPGTSYKRIHGRSTEARVHMKRNAQKLPSGLQEGITEPREV